MIEIKGAYNTAICHCITLEQTAAEQIKTVCDQEYFADSKIRIMPDVHAGLGCTIGTTMTITDKVVPGMVGVDIGCGMETVRIAERKLDFAKLDALIRKEIPSGRNIRSAEHELVAHIALEELICAYQVDLDRARKSIGTLGGGNHFIEEDTDKEGRLYLVVHSGSRHLGTEVARYYQEVGYKELQVAARCENKEIIQRLKDQGRTKEINVTLKKMEREHKKMVPVSKDLAYVEGTLFEDYIHDMKLVQRFAVLNRKAMVDVIVNGLGLTVEEQFTTIHNYIDTDSMILRKGAISAKKGEKMLIPINMRDGSLICIGKGNEDWNCSAPHGAGRIMSRKEALDSLSMEQYTEEMEGIFTTCVNRGTLDEAPMAYKSMEEIAGQIEPTAEIVSRIRPLYNFKASE